MCQPENFRNEWGLAADDTFPGFALIEFGAVIFEQLELERERERERVDEGSRFFAFEITFTFSTQIHVHQLPFKRLRPFTFSTSLPLPLKLPLFHSPVPHHRLIRRTLRHHHPLSLYQTAVDWRVDATISSFRLPPPLSLSTSLFTRKRASSFFVQISFVNLWAQSGDAFHEGKSQSVVCLLPHLNLIEHRKSNLAFSATFLFVCVVSSDPCKSVYLSSTLSLSRSRNCLKFHFRFHSNYRNNRILGQVLNYSHISGYMNQTLFFTLKRNACLTSETHGSEW
jgi:hypothetical protein